jgi:cytochrome c oxidase subunit 2
MYPVFFMLMFICPFLGYAKDGQPHKWQIYFQTPASPMMVGIERMHYLLLITIICIAVVVTALLGYVMWRYRAKKNPVPGTTTHHTVLEIVWTFIPVCIVAIIAVPSVHLLYEMEKPQDPEMTVKAIGKQWYWTYEYPQKDGKNISFDSMLIRDNDLKSGQLRLLDVDNRIVVPIHTTVQLLITAEDVIHSFAVPSLGIKKDAVPGRINETWFRIDKEGVYYGQCSELCGKDHGFMPIAVHVVSKKDYQEWLQTKIK